MGGALADSGAPTAPVSPGLSRFVSRVVTAAAALLLLVGVVQALDGSQIIGISTDEPNHQLRMNQWFEHGWYLPEVFLDANGQPDPTIEVGRLHAYGAGYSVFGHLVAVLAGAETWGQTSPTAEAYDARHLAVAILGIGSALTVGYALWVVTDARLVGLWAAAAVVAMPLWIGYSMFAVKDVPSAAGWTMVSAAMAVALLPGKWRRTSAVGLLAAAGVWFSIGVRTALWVPISAALVVFAGLAFLRRRSRAALRQAAAVTLGMLVGFGAVVMFHYRNAANFIDWLVSSVRTSADFHQTGATLTAGQLVTEKPPWWYLPAWIGGSTPILLGVLAVIGMIAVLVGVVRSRTQSDSVGMIFFGHQLVTLPLIAVMIHATMYAGLRQHLYVLPALAALSAFGLHTLAIRGERQVLIGILAASALLIPMGEQLQLWPYQFVYKNLFAGPVEDRWEADMHFVSGREAISRVPVGVDAWCYTESLRLLSGKVRKPAPILCALHPRVSPFVRYQGIDAPAEAEEGRMWMIGRKYRGSPPAEGCIEVDNVTRRLRSSEITLGYVLRCDPAQYATSGETGAVARPGNQ